MFLGPPWLRFVIGSLFCKNKSNFLYCFFKSVNKLDTSYQLNPINRNVFSALLAKVRGADPHQRFLALDSIFYYLRSCSYCLCWGVAPSPNYFFDTKKYSKKIKSKLSFFARQDFFFPVHDPGYPPKLVRPLTEILSSTASPGYFDRPLRFSPVGELGELVVPGNGVSS